MTRQDAENLLAEAGQASDETFPLFDAALACAVHEDPDRDPGPAIQLGRDAIEKLAARLDKESPEEAIAEAMAGDLRLEGDVLTYDSPANADLIHMVERRKGLPVMLGVVYIHAARGCKLQVHGVDFPGHFLLRVETREGPMALDPFSEGRIVLPSELSRRALRAGLTPDVASRLEALMAPVSDRAVLIRLQNNIFARAQERADWPAAERSALRRALINPADHRPWLDVARAREGQGALVGAQEALGRATILDGGAAVSARAARERVRMQLN